MKYNKRKNQIQPIPYLAPIHKTILTVIIAWSLLRAIYNSIVDNRNQAPTHAKPAKSKSVFQKLSQKLKWGYGTISDERKRNYDLAVGFTPAYLLGMMQIAPQANSLTIWIVLIPIYAVLVFYIGDTAAKSETWALAGGSEKEVLNRVMCGIIHQILLAGFSVSLIMCLNLKGLSSILVSLLVSLRSTFINQSYLTIQIN